MSLLYLIAAALSVAPAQATPGRTDRHGWPVKASELERKIQAYDQEVVGYRALQRRAAAIRHSLILGDEYWVTLPLPEAPERIGGVGPEHIVEAPADTLVAFQQRIADERDRGYRHWFAAAAAPARYRPFEPVDSEGEGLWSREVFSDWLEQPAATVTIPELGDLLGDLQPRPSAPTPGEVPPGMARGLLARLQQAVDAAEVFRISVAGRLPQWINQGGWEEVVGVAERSATLIQADLSSRRRVILASIGYWMANLAQWEFLQRPGQRPEWDRAFDRGVLPLLPQPIRLELERRLAAAYFRGAWEAKRSQHDWWRRNGRSVAELATLKEAKAEWDLRPRYLYEL